MSERDLSLAKQLSSRSPEGVKSALKAVHRLYFRRSLPEVLASAIVDSLDGDAPHSELLSVVCDCPTAALASRFRSLVCGENETVASRAISSLPLWSSFPDLVVGVYDCVWSAARSERPDAASAACIALIDVFGEGEAAIKALVDSIQRSRLRPEHGLESELLELLGAKEVSAINRELAHRRAPPLGEPLDPWYR